MIHSNFIYSFFILKYYLLLLSPLKCYVTQKMLHECQKQKNVLNIKLILKICDTKQIS